MKRRKGSSVTKKCPSGAAGLQTPTGIFLLSRSERVAAKETVQLLHFAGGIVWLDERFDELRSIQRHASTGRKM